MVSALTHQRPRKPGGGAGLESWRSGLEVGEQGLLSTAGIKLWGSFLGPGLPPLYGLGGEAQEVFWGHVTFVFICFWFSFSFSSPLPSARFLPYGDNIIVFLNIKIHALGEKSQTVSKCEDKHKNNP